MAVRALCLTPKPRRDTHVVVNLESECIVSRAARDRTRGAAELALSLELLESRIVTAEEERRNDPGPGVRGIGLRDNASQQLA
jgi:hypothetical protein